MKITERDIRAAAHGASRYETVQERQAYVLGYLLGGRAADDPERAAVRYLESVIEGRDTVVEVLNSDPQARAA